MLLRPQCQQDVSRRCREVGVRKGASAALSGALKDLHATGGALGERVGEPCRMRWPRSGMRTLR